jgi:hypothetical protein
MKIKYLYLDDEDPTETKNIADLLEAENESIKIETATPLTFSKQMANLKSRKIDGLILDLRLDVVTNNNEKAEYRALTLATEIRTRVTEGSLNDFPIIICSTDTKLRKSYNKNIVGHDLFDLKYLKSEDMIEDSERVAEELYSIASGYKDINKIKTKYRIPTLANYLHITPKDIFLIDERFLKHSFGTAGILPTYEYARFILKEVILKQGLLVGENVLLARFGIDVESRDKALFLETIMKSFKYKGPFNEAWPRWWWPLANNWWYKNFMGLSNLASLNAKERVEQLVKKTKLKLSPADAIRQDYSTRFWTVCQLYNKPLDSIDGFLIEQSFEPYPWQENSYISMAGSTDIDAKAQGLAINSIDKNRFTDYKNAIK